MYKVICCVAVLLSASQAGAYVCSRVPDATGQEPGPSLSWYTRNITFTLDASGTSQIPGLEELDALRAAFAVWEYLIPEAPDACEISAGATDIRFTETALSTQRYIGYDYSPNAVNENLVLFRDDDDDDDWPYMDKDGKPFLAFTTVTYNVLTGEIFDADIEINTQNFTFSIDEVHNDADLMGIMVHEIGHVLGLGHTVGNAALDLSDIEARDTTMYPFVGPGETKKRTLHCDDARGIAFKYPASTPNQYCDPVDPACAGCAPPEEHYRDNSHIVVITADDRAGGCSAMGGSLIMTLAVMMVLLVLILRLMVRNFCIPT